MKSLRSIEVGVVGAALSLVSCRADGRVLASEDASSGTSSAAAAELTLVAEKKLSKLLSGNGVDHYGASGVTVSGGMLYVVLDNITRVAGIDTALHEGSLGPGDLTASNYEGIAGTDDGRFYTVVEIADPSDPRAKLVELDGTTAETSSTFTDTSFNNNEGFEGLGWVRVDGAEYLLALCQNNDCKSADTEPGKGRVHVLSFVDGLWTTQAVLKVPRQAAFLDYSDLALRPNGDGTYVTAIVSRKSSAVWIGRLTTSPWALTGPSSFYTFPKTRDREVQYCTLEGVTFLGPNVLAFASDNGDGKAPCSDKEESVHIFNVPH